MCQLYLGITGKKLKVLLILTRQLLNKINWTFLMDSSYTKIKKCLLFLAYLYLELDQTRMYFVKISLKAVVMVMIYILKLLIG